MQVKNYIIPELFTIKNLENKIVTFLPAQSLAGCRTNVLNLQESTGKKYSIPNNNLKMQRKSRLYVSRMP